MAINLEKIKSRLNSISNNGKSNLIWKPSPGKQVIRIVPYKHNTENPFIELKFHYGLNGKTYLSPDSFNRPDPIVEFSNKLKRSGDKEEWKFGRKIEPKMRTFAPVIVRGQESEGVKFWGFGKNVYQEILAIIADPDFGDITDLVKGRDVVVEFKTAVETGKQYPETGIRVKPNVSPAVDPNNKDLVSMISNQPNLLEVFPELSYDELKAVMEAWLASNDTENSGNEESVPTVDEVETAAVEVAKNPTNKSPSATVAKSNVEDVTKAFDNLFNS